MGSKNSDGVTYTLYEQLCYDTSSLERLWDGGGVACQDELGIKGAIHKIHTRDRRLSIFICDVTHIAVRYCHVTVFN